MNEQNDNQPNGSRALDRPREYPLAPPAYYAYPEEEAHLRDYLNVIIRRKWIILIFLVTVVTSVTIGTMMTKPLYRATATLKIDNQALGMVAIKDNSLMLDHYSPDYYEAQYKILKSRNLATRVLRQIQSDMGGEFGAPEVKAPQAQPAILARASVEKNAAISPSMVDNFIGRVEVSPDPKTARLVKVSFVSSNPELASKATNALSRSFIELNMESRYGATQQAREWLENQLEVMKAKMEQAEEKLNEYASKNQIIFLAHEANTPAMNLLTKKLSEISTELTAATADRISKESVYNELTIGDVASSSAVLKDENVRDLLKDITKRESEYEENLKTYKPDYPKMVRMKENIDQLKKRLDQTRKNIAESVKRDYLAAQKRERYLQSEFDRYKGEVLDQNSRSVQYQILKREADTNKELYDGLLQKLKEAGLSASVTASDVQILDKAETPKAPFKPNTGRNIMMSILVGLFGGIGLAFFAEYLNNTVRTPEDVEKKIYMPSLGLVPLYSRNPGSSPVEYISHLDSKHSLTEAYSSIRTFLLFSTAGRPPKVMLITSARREEGKTTTSINTAISLSKSDARVLIVDADMRRPRLHKVFKVSNSAGLSSFLSGNLDSAHDLIRKTDVAGLDVVTSGPLPPNPAELLSSYRLREFIEGLYPLYEFIIFDTPPILGLADAPIISTMTDGVILVVRAGQTPSDAVKQAKKILENVNAKMLGVVLNAITASDMRYGSYSYYQYYYQNYTGDETK